MLLFDFRPPSILNVDRSVSEACCLLCSVSATSSRDVECMQLSARLLTWALGREAVGSQPRLEKTSATTMLALRLLWKPTGFFGARRRKTRCFFFYRKFVKKDSAEGQTSQKSLASKQCREASGKQPSSTVSRSRKVCRYNPRWSTSTLTFNSF